MGLRAYFKDAKLARMSDGSYCIVRDLGLVKGGKGLKHFENLLRLTLPGIVSKLVELARHLTRFHRDSSVREMSRVRVARPFKHPGADIQRVA